MLQFLLSIADEKDHAKIEYLYNQYHDDMLRFAKYRLRQKGMPNYELDAEDAVQNAFLKITKYIHKVDFTVGEKGIRAYVLKIASNEVSGLISDYTFFENIEEYNDTMGDGDFFEQMRIKERYDEVVEEIGRLDEKYSISLSLRYGENMGTKEIADLLGVSEKTVYTRIDRAKKLLVEKLNGENKNE
ncbi:MAG: RNA polymerase sigma factor [Clostridia bacterium]|nr:RNA polymerase sigma factor [Clostridia bacterium]